MTKLFKNYFQAPPSDIRQGELEKKEMTMKRIINSAAPLLLLSACGSEPVSGPEEIGSVTTTEDSSATQLNTETGNIETGASTDERVKTTAVPPAGFAQCRTCHSVERDGPNGVGPNLWGVAEKPAAQHTGFTYSTAMKSSGLTWDAATLDIFLKEPMKTVPGTKMAYAGLRDGKQRAEVIAYIGRLRD